MVAIVLLSGLVLPRPATAGDLPETVQTGELFIGLAFRSICDPKSNLCKDVGDPQAPRLASVIPHRQSGIASSNQAFRQSEAECLSKLVPNIQTDKQPLTRDIQNKEEVESIFQNVKGRSKILAAIQQISSQESVQIDDVLAEIADDNQLGQALHNMDHACLRRIARDAGSYLIVFSRMHGVARLKLRLDYTKKKSDLETNIAELYSLLERDCDFTIDRKVGTLTLKFKFRIPFELRAKPILSFVKYSPELFQ